MAKIVKEAPLYVESVDNQDASTHMIVSYPKTFDDVQVLISNLRDGQSVIFNLEGVSSSMAQRMLDFMAGAAFALGGSMQRIQSAMFLVTHKGVGIAVRK